MIVPIIISARRSAHGDRWTSFSPMINQHQQLFISGGIGREWGRHLHPHTVNAQKWHKAHKREETRVDRDKQTSARGRFARLSWCGDVALFGRQMNIHFVSLCFALLSRFIVHSINQCAFINRIQRIKSLSLNESKLASLFITSVSRLSRSSGHTNHWSTLGASKSSISSSILSSRENYSVSDLFPNSTGARRKSNPNFTPTIGPHYHCICQPIKLIDAQISHSSGAIVWETY